MRLAVPIAVALVLGGCSAGPAEPPAYPLARRPRHRSTEPRARPPATPPGTEIAPESCAAANPDRQGCLRWEVRQQRCSAGVAPGYFVMSYCACDLCASDGDCGARPGGRCVSFSYADHCPAPRNLCVYPDNPCYPPGRCPPDEGCFVGDGDAPSCQPPPPPSA